MRFKSVFKRVISSVLALSLLVLCFAALCMPQITIQAYSASGDGDRLEIQISGQERIMIPYDAEKHGMPFTVVYKINGEPKGSAADISVDLKDGEGRWQSDVYRDGSGNVKSYIRPLTSDDFDIYVATSSNYVRVEKSLLNNRSEMMIMPAPLTITARDQTVVYNGEKQGPGDTVYKDPAEIAELIDIEGLKGQDSITWLTVDGQGTDVGVYDLIPSNAVLNEAPKIRNYDIKYVNGKLTIGYQVSVTAGAHMTVTGDSGELRQIVPGGNIVPLSFTADEGYYFSKDYSVETKDGIEVTRVSESEIKVSGTPKANIEITLPDAELKETPPVPPEPHVHELTLVEAEEATCTEDGNSAYYVCDGCGKWFEDATGLVEITDKSAVIIKALGHKWDSGVVTKAATATKDGIRTYTCLHDSRHTKTEPIPATGRKDSNRSEHTVSPLPDAWVRDEAGWHFRENGVLVKNAWRKLEYNGESYWYLFDENGTMKTGWAEWRGEKYYLNPVSDGWMGRMLTGWQEIDGKRYYFETVLGNNQGRMYRSEGTPDGYYVGADGVWQ